jgi:hypothetical protein
MRIRSVIFEPVSALSDIELFISVMFDEEFYQKSSVLEARRMLLDGFEKVNSYEFPFSSCLITTCAI